MNDTIVVKQSKKGTILYSIGAILMSLASLLLVFVNFRSEDGSLSILTQNDILYILLKVILVIGFFFFGICFIFILKRAKEGKEILVVNNEGITDNSSALAFGFIPWSDIDKVYIDSVMGNQFIELVINNEDKYISTLNGIKKNLVLTNKKMGHQLVCISLNSTGVSPQTILPKIQEIFKKVKKQSSSL